MAQRKGRRKKRVFETRLERVWFSAAKRLGATVTDGVPEMVVPYGDVWVTIEGLDADNDRVFPRLRQTSTFEVRATASPILAALPRFTVRPEAAWDRFTRRHLKGQDIELGKDPPLFHDLLFDQVFVVKGRAIEQIRSLWTDVARKEFLRLYNQTSHEVDRPALVIDGQHDRVRLEYLVYPEQLDTRLLRSVVRVVGEIATCDLYGLAALKSLPGAVYHPPTVQPARGPSVRITSPCLAYYRPLVESEEVRTQVGLVQRAAKGDVSMRLGDAGDSPRDDLLMETFGPHFALASKVGKGDFECRRGKLTFTWDAVATNTEHLLRAAMLLEAVVVLPTALDQGIYR